jgi:hypothetical protein
MLTNNNILKFKRFKFNRLIEKSLTFYFSKKIKTDVSFPYDQKQYEF